MSDLPFYIRGWNHAAIFNSSIQPIFGARITNRWKLFLVVSLILSVPANYSTGYRVMFYAWCNAVVPDHWPAIKNGQIGIRCYNATGFFAWLFIYNPVALVKDNQPIVPSNDTYTNQLFRGWSEVRCTTRDTRNLTFIQEVEMPCLGLSIFRKLKRAGYSILLSGIRKLQSLFNLCQVG